MTTEEATKAIRDAWRAGLYATGVSLLLTAIYSTGTGLTHLAPANLIELVALPVLSYGIYRNSRVAAVLMLVYFIGSKVVLWLDERVLIGVPIALFFTYFFWRGVRGTFAYHRSQNDPQTARA